MKEFVAYLVKNLVDRPEAVDVRCVEGEKGLLVELRVDPDDIGQVVGRKGATINALRTVVTTVCARFGQRIRLELIE